MPTSKKRVNISLPEDIEKMLSILAERDDMPEATKALHLIMLALEIEEDDVFDALASARDTGEASFVSHAKAWK